MHKKKLATDKEFAHASGGTQSVSTGKLMDNSEWKPHIRQHLYDVREMIDSHIEQIHTSITENVKQTIKTIQNAQKCNKNLLKRPSGGAKMVKLNPSMLAISQLWDQVASHDASAETPLQMINARQKEIKRRITLGEEEALRAVRMTKGERIATSSKLPSRRAIQVDSKIDRFKRQNGVTVKVNYFSIISHLISLQTNSLAIASLSQMHKSSFFYSYCIVL